MVHLHRLLLLSLWLALPIAGLGAQEPSALNYDVVWTTPSKDASESMPLGNGDVGVNAWITPDAKLSFYISKTDCWSDNGRLLKVGRMHITLDPPLDPSDAFSQRLVLNDGIMLVSAGSEQSKVQVALWVDAHQEAIHVEIESASNRSATAEIDLWRTERTPYPLAEVSGLMEDRSQLDRLYQEVFVGRILFSRGARIASAGITSTASPSAQPLRPSSKVLRNSWKTRMTNCCTASSAR